MTDDSEEILRQQYGPQPSPLEQYGTHGATQFGPFGRLALDPRKLADLASGAWGIVSAPFRAAEDIKKNYRPGAENEVVNQDIGKQAFDAGSVIMGGAPMVENNAVGIFGGKVKGYHGSPQAGLSEVHANPATRQYDNATSQFGAFFSPDQPGARRYGSNLYEAKAGPQNPYEMPAGEFFRYQGITKRAGQELPPEQWGARADELKAEASAHRQELADQGYDGIVVRKRDGTILEMSSFDDVPVAPVAGGADVAPGKNARVKAQGELFAGGNRKAAGAVAAKDILEQNYRAEFGPTVYHGTPDVRGIKEEGFKTLKQRYGQEDPEAVFFFAKDYPTAKTYADPHRAFDYQNAEPGVIPAQLRMTNPKEIDWGGRPFRGRDVDENGFAIRDHINAARDAGHDGFVIHNVIDDYNAKGKPKTIMGVFDASRIRHPDAAFDPAHADSSNLLAAGGNNKAAAGVAAKDILEAEYGKGAEMPKPIPAELEGLAAQARKFKSPQEFMAKTSTIGDEMKGLDKLAFGVTDGQELMVDPKKLYIKHKGDLENAKAEKQIPYGDDAPPADVSLQKIGGKVRWVVEDGHHRYWAAKRDGKPLKVRIDSIQTNPFEPLGYKGYDDFMEAFYGQVHDTKP